MWYVPNFFSLSLERKQQNCDSRQAQFKQNTSLTMAPWKAALFSHLVFSNKDIRWGKACLKGP